MLFTVTYFCWKNLRIQKFTLIQIDVLLNLCFFIFSFLQINAFHHKYTFVVLCFWKFLNNWTYSNWRFCKFMLLLIFVLLLKFTFTICKLLLIFFAFTNVSFCKFTFWKLVLSKICTFKNLCLPRFQNNCLICPNNYFVTAITDSSKIIFILVSVFFQKVRRM